MNLNYTQNLKAYHQSRAVGLLACPGKLCVPDKVFFVFNLTTFEILFTSSTDLACPRTDIRVLASFNGI